MIIRVIDVETTGIDPATSGVCEIGFCDVRAFGSDLAGDPIDWRVIPGSSILINPGVPIPPDVSAVHHIIDEDVVDAGPWPAAAMPVFGQTTADGIPIIAFAAHSAKFEREFIPDDLVGGRPWACTYKCALRLWPDAPLHSNQGLRYWRRPEGLDRHLASVSHRAFPDAYVTAFHLRDMLNGGAAVEQLIEWSSQPALQVRCHIGKWRGTPWREVDYGFLQWVAAREFDEDVMFTVQAEMERRDKELAAAAAADDEEMPF